MTEVDQAFLTTELARFPCQDVCQECRTFLRQHREHLTATRWVSLWKAPIVEPMLAEVRKAEEAWNDLYYAHWKTSFAYEHLSDLKLIIGESNYKLGFMPIPIMPWMQDEPLPKEKTNGRKLQPL